MKEKKYGIYSEKQAQSYGCFEYTSPDGKIVIVSEVGNIRGCPVPNCIWDDKVDVGEVVDFVSRVSYGKFGGALR